MRSIARRQIIFERSAPAQGVLDTAERLGSAVARVTPSILVVVVLACSSDDKSDEASATAATSSGQTTGAASSPVYEQLDCDLPAVIEYCGGATCHYDSASQDLGSSLALWDRANQRVLDDIEERLVNAPAGYHNVQNADECPSEAELLVDTSDAEQSLILKKLMGTQACGDEMPKFPYPEWGATNNPGPQRDEFVSCIQDWVTLLVQDYNESP